MDNNNYEERLLALENIVNSFFEKKTKSVVKKMDSTGRIVIPKNIRMMIDCENGGDFKIYSIGEKIILEKVVDK